MYDLFDKFYENVIKYNLINPKENIVAGISGGIDSVVLFDLLVRLTNLIDYNLMLHILTMG